MYTSSRSARVGKLFTFVIAVAIPMVVGVISSLLSGDLKAQYNAMVQPPFSPPDWLFGIMWPVLYLLMGVASYLIITSSAGNTMKMTALALYAIQLLANALWSPIFFRGDMLWAAFVVILIMDILVVATIMSFGSIRRVAAVLLVPYLVWILFATYLNLGFALLN